MASLQDERAPPAYSSHDPETVVLPAVPSHELPSRQNISLPQLKSLNLPTSDAARRGQFGPPLRQPHWSPPSNFTFGHQDHHARAQVGGPALQGAVPHLPSIGALDSDTTATSVEGTARASSVMSMDDAETMAAAEALSGLRNHDHQRSPPARGATLPHNPWPDHSNTHQSPPPLFHQMRASSPTATSENGEEPEPLLKLITESHPWLGGTINGSLNVYNNTMNSSPAIIRSSARFLERNIGSPITSGIGNVSRRTGVEGTVRRYFGEGQPRKHSESAILEDEYEGEERNKRRRVHKSIETADLETGGGMAPVSRDGQYTLGHNYRSRAGSQTSFAESLPAYDENRAPGYYDCQSGQGDNGQFGPPARRASASGNHWGTRFMITTSGLGVAMSESSLKSLRYCLRFLHSSVDNLTSIMHALRKLINEYEDAYSSRYSHHYHHQHHHHRNPQSQSSITQDGGSSDRHRPPYSLTPAQSATADAIADKIKTYGSQILSTIQDVILAVSTYAGSALPANAGALVRRQLLSVPQRWRVASEEAERAVARVGGASAAGPGTVSDDREVSPGDVGPMDVAGHGHSSPASPSGGAPAHAEQSLAMVRVGEKWLEFARQGCDMITQVGLVVGGTVESAEQWLEVVGKRRRERAVSGAGAGGEVVVKQETVEPGAEKEKGDGDVEMEDVAPKGNGNLRSGPGEGMGWGEKR